MKLLVLGASGRTGTEVVRRALLAGHDVTAFVREPRRLAVRDTRLKVRTGDARDAADLRAVLAGQDAVITTLGGSSRDGLIEKSTAALMQAAGEEGVQRVVMLSSYMLGPNFEGRGLMRLLAGLFKGMMADKAAGEALLKHSGLEWTIVYASRLAGRATAGRLRTVASTETMTYKDEVARADVAQFLLDKLIDQESVRKAFVVTA